MADGYDVLFDELRAHASRLDALRERLDAAVGAAQQVSMGDEAYGKICSFFVPVVHAVSDPGMDALRRAAESMSETAREVRDTGQTYEATEQANTRPFAAGGGA
ncbi:Excreted virulence factor EspC, type VII ESX diderm [Streptoalloteichus tenebrarius]|uniref:Excreted virulence factor EspC, type VII ESX diderm n=1 Tax=Streptoalloteichus tenebrarius (strain ATCC 17920 / DSM 40477 / JCM 4838 / CBS 697.72 / NBRC 16177 / NCIMB 11028 / NRRL B-12390 / A12253. 1 / ISP 5477) TaxID=1933 RepID=A0ABT1HYY2_STRSD|nr:type VII secretion target [Streptoalloteichus tenebrarius]MCP2260734.1 Excreted virulence factor EspC, type VII ESX diderm [Streptoalloteichus tenebrarius]BFF03455.1 type VII secretion target [Streptoalloteichus tenebrarius]